ncbi:cytochrome P450 [Fennellomyces sp. T-0311]|nr:cytochrome P450 [Fennellomyces sp. T-0311]
MPIIQDLVLQSDQRRLGLIGAAVFLAAYAFYQHGSENDQDGAYCPTVPYTHPMFGSTEEYKKDPAAFVEKWSAELGPVFRVHIFGRLQTVVSGNYVREILLNNNFSFAEGFRTRFDIRLLTNIPESQIDDKRFREVIVKSLTAQMKKYIPRAVDYLNIGLKEALGDLKEPRVLENLFSTVQHMVAKASASIFVGEHLCKDEDLVETFKNITTEVGSEIRFDNKWLHYFERINQIRMWYSGKHSQRVRNHRRQLMKSMAPEIDRRLQGLAGNDPSWTRPEDILQEIIENYPPPPTCDIDIYNYYANWMIVLIFASVHTTTEHGTIVLYRLLQHPDIIEELLREQNEVLGGSTLFTGEVVRKLVKLDSVCREALRFKNDFFALPHRNVSGGNIALSNGVVIKPGDNVLLNVWSNHRDSNLQRDIHGNHDTFEPFRFVNTDRPATKIGDDYLVFGEGKHACPGRWFALQEIKTIVSALIRDYKITPCGPIKFPTGIDTGIPSGKVMIQRKI